MNHFKVAVFRPDGQFATYDLSFCEENLALLRMNATDESMADEFYNIHEIYLTHGVVPQIKMQKRMLSYKN